GGTFTDIVLLDAGGTIHTKKVSSSVDDYARAIVEGLDEVFRDTGLAGRDFAEVLHGTTVASNAILELKGARTGLITTKGFRDVLEIRRIRMPKLYDLAWEKPVTLVERYLRLEVDKRLDVHGRVERALDPAARERLRLYRDLSGRSPHPTRENVRPGRAKRDAVPDLREERARPGEGVR